MYITSVSTLPDKDLGTESWWPGPLRADILGQTLDS